MLDMLVDISVDTMVVSLPDTSEVMVTTLASVRPKLSLKRMLDMLVGISVDTMVVSLPDTSEVTVTTLVSVRLKLMLDMSVDTMADLVAFVDLILDMLATVDTLDKLRNIKINTAGGSVSSSYDCDASSSGQSYYRVHQGFRSVGKIVKFEHTSRPIPDHNLCPCNDFSKESPGLGPTV